MVTVTNVVMMRNFDVMSVKFNVVGICTSGNYMQNELLNYIIITLQFWISSQYKLKLLIEGYSLQLLCRTSCFIRKGQTFGIIVFLYLLPSLITFEQSNGFFLKLCMAYEKRNFMQYPEIFYVVCFPVCKFCQDNFSVECTTAWQLLLTWCWYLMNDLTQTSGIFLQIQVINITSNSV